MTPWDAAGQDSPYRAMWADLLRGGEGVVHPALHKVRELSLSRVDLSHRQILSVLPKYENYCLGDGLSRHQGALYSTFCDAMTLRVPRSVRLGTCTSLSRKTVAQTQSSTL